MQLLPAFAPSVGLLTSPPPRPDPLSPSMLLSPNACLLTTSLPPRLPPRRKSLEEVARLFGSGEVAVSVSHRFSLEQAPEAFSIMLNRQVRAGALLVQARSESVCSVRVGRAQVSKGQAGRQALGGQQSSWHTTCTCCCCAAARVPPAQVIGKILLLPQPRSML